MIANVNLTHPNIPIINISFPNLSVPVLVDTGSSVSLISKSFFNQHKNSLKYRHLSRSVKISTLNSDVKFIGCVDISFKINSAHYRHPMFICEFNSSSSFDGLLGFDFIRKYNLVIIPDIESCKINNEYIPFLNKKSTFINASIQCNISNTENNLPPTKCVDFSQLLHAEPFIPKHFKEMRPSQDLSVSLTQKLVLSPRDSAFIKVKCTLPDVSFLDKDLIFIPRCVNEFIKAENALVCLSTGKPPELTNHLQSSTSDSTIPSLYSSTTQNNSHKNLFKTFYVYVENISNDNFIHVNKNTCLGHLFQTEDIQEHFLPDSTEEQAHLNLITASQEVINKRRKEFSKDKVKMAHLNSSQQVKLFTILKNNFTAFSSSLETLGHSDRVSPELNFTSDFSIKALPFPIPYSLQSEAKRQIDEMIAAGIIEKNIASWSCPLLLVKKKGDGTKVQHRLALDLRLLNSVIEHSSYPLPRIQSIITNMAQYQYFTVLDMPSAYWQVHLPEKYQDKLSFTSQWGTHKFKRLPFGLKNAASYFQALADSIIEEVNMLGIESYQDDFVICSNSFEETLEKLNKFLQVFSKYNLTLNLAKCSFHQTEINFLGFHLKNNRIFPLSSNIQKINSFPIPTTKKHVKRFLGLCGFYRSLIPSFAQLTEPLVALTSPSTPFRWTSTENEAFQKLQQVFFKNPFIIQPNFSKTFFLNTDASGFAISAVLMQEANGVLLPISYFSKGLRGAEKRYAPIQQELMAIVYGIRAFRYLLYGRPFIILSDSKPLAHFRKTESPAKMITRWLLELSEYTFTFQHIPGKFNILADYLSRTPVQHNSTTLNEDPNLAFSKDILPIVPNEVNFNNCENNLNECVNTNVTNSNLIPKDPPLEISIETIKFHQEKDKEIKKIIKGIRTNNKKFNKFLICPSTNVVLYINETTNNTCKSVTYRIVLPQALHQKCLQIYHHSHLGIDKTFKLISEKFYWYGLFSDVVKFVNSCATCIKMKNFNIPKAPFQNSFIPSRPGQFLSIDFVGPFKNNMYILSVIDHFSKFIQLFPMRNITAMNAVDAIFSYVSIHGRPEVILADNGTQFKSHIFKEFNHMLGINLKFITIRHPQANGVSERINKSIKSTVYALMEDGYSFTNAIRIHQMMYNASFHSTIKTTPNNIHFGRPLTNFMDTFNPVDFNLRVDVEADYYKICSNLHQLYEEIHQNLISYQQLQNSRQKNPKLRIFNIGDTVFMTNSNAFHKSSSGPYEVIEKISDVILKIKLANDPQAPAFNVHINKLRILPKRKPNRWSPVDDSQESNDQTQNISSTSLTSIHQNLNIPSPPGNSNTEHCPDISSNNIPQTQSIIPALHSPPRVAPGLFSSSVMTHPSTSSTDPTYATTTVNKHFYNLRSRKKNS